MPSSLRRISGVNDKIRPNINPYVSKVLHASEDGLPLFYGEQLKNQAGKWMSGCESNNFVLEIGCYEGQTLAHFCENHPQTKFLGIDMTYKRVYLSAKKLQEAQLTNGAIAFANARQIDEFLAPGEVNGVCIFFPDPWNKKPRQKPKRLFCEEFLQQLLRVINSNGFLWIKTDCADYFEVVRALMSATGHWRKGATICPPQFITQETLKTPFEKRYTAKGLPIYQAFWIKN